MTEKGLSPVETPEEYEAAWDDVFASVQATCEEEGARVRAVGGLYVLGTERHESRRIDNQLRGRSGRQGDPGESRFYLSLQDDLMRLFNASAAQSLMARTSDDDEDLAIESKVVSRAIQSAQSQVEARNAEVRKNVLKYDDVLNRQRQAIYEDRRQILEGDDISDQVTVFVEKTITVVIAEKLDNMAPEDWDLEGLWTDLKTLYPVGITIDELVQELGQRATVEDVTTEVLSDCRIAYQKREEALGSAVMRELERRVVLSVVDRRWRDHLYEMDYLKDGIGLRAMAQRDPLVEYQREGFALFQTMMGQIREDTTGYVFNLEVQIQQPTAQVGPIVSAKGLMDQAPQQNLSYTAPTADGDVEVRNQSGQVVQAPQAPAVAGVSQTFQGQPGVQVGAPAARQTAAGPPPGTATRGSANRAQRRAAKRRKK